LLSRTGTSISFRPRVAVQAEIAVKSGAHAAPALLGEHGDDREDAVDPLREDDADRRADGRALDLHEHTSSIVTLS
jgi:hypothetical protein